MLPDQPEAKEPLGFFVEAYKPIRDFLKARIHQLEGQVLTKSQQTKIAALPSRFMAASVEQSIRDIKVWAERPAQLQLFFKTTGSLLKTFGLDKFQSSVGGLR
jgi:hypothetical protein